ncbi:DNA processing protein [Salirhabdus euzebyi]|uniref:DNA processing protein n=1 Tax=Salirhabdus euzebyi TaxID=394506 RepID=A0A841Q3G2_9BACI|nr:DNA-processing protein DprA [Salirhabdus euzebyi]MBB6452936.1 DNA processing protein [Salirhabdus euzebyi]
MSGIHSGQLMHTIEKDMEKYHVITCNHKTYPPLLKRIPDPPILLYGLGNINFLKIEPKISVVGTRNHSNEAERKVEFLLKPLLHKEWLIVSGMAKGIDSIAHRLAINNTSKTIAILGFGFQHIYPKENISLMQELAKNHLLLSEYAPDEAPKPWHFPERNRIISGLTFGSLIVEAKERSGTFITAEQALDQGREVFVVPGSILHPQSKGCHLLIQEGANLVKDANDLLNAWETYKTRSINY